MPQTRKPRSQKKKREVVQKELSRKRERNKTVEDEVKTKREKSSKANHVKKAGGREGARKRQRDAAAPTTTPKPEENKGGACQSNTNGTESKERVEKCSLTAGQLTIDIWMSE